jgi:hypothetical protein
VVLVDDIVRARNELGIAEQAGLNRVDYLRSALPSSIETNLGGVSLAAVRELAVEAGKCLDALANGKLRSNLDPCCIARRPRAINCEQGSWERDERRRDVTGRHELVHPGDPRIEAIGSCRLEGRRAYRTARPGTSAGRTRQPSAQSGRARKTVSNASEASVCIDYDGKGMELPPKRGLGLRGRERTRERTAAFA